MNLTNHIASKETKDSYYLTEILEGMLYYIPIEKPLGSMGNIHQIIYEIKPKYNLLNDFIFSTKGICPVSEKLSEVLFGLLIIKGIYYLPFVRGKGEKLKISPGFQGHIKKEILPNFSKEELKQLKEMANDYVNVALKYVK